ncbi:hypothetical protein LSUE1_G005223 [Lachnellula suecica]|uniref:Alpha-L-rhamnosidase six-hairpin glycosidase domain-containing protein n=1 Tax=Lachnellula suecica TaxID=602035 RepID=A0A8T9CHU3_9HELO|nr:hypothetical protein LSUE1_G005223 [Lachnellula suecica]
MRRPLQEALVGLVFYFKACSAVPYSDYILAPSSRTIIPTSVRSVNGTITNIQSLTTANGSATFQGVSSVTFDFQRNIAGIVSLDIGSSSSDDAFLGVTFTESSLWICSQASDATADSGLDEPLWFHVGNGSSIYTAEPKHQRGAFRYMTLTGNTSATVEVKGVGIYFTAAPSQDLQAYSGYFHSNDELLNRVWYSGAYTNQLCSIDPNYGDAIPFFNEAIETNPDGFDKWWSNYTVTNGTSATVDGAKRDRLVWPGDMVISIPSIFVSTNDLYSVINSLESLLRLQMPNGMLPYAGAPFTTSGIEFISFTYHLHNLIAMAYYYQYSGDLSWLSSHWDQFKLGIEWSLSSVDSTGLMNVTSSSDWLRSGMGGHNIEANAILYYTLNLGLDLASILNDSSITTTWSNYSTNIKSAAYDLLWDDSTGLYRDNETTSLYPQDGNSWAIKANLTIDDQQASAITAALQSRWGTYGAPAPEAGETVSPFISGFEVESHFLSGNATSALDLVRLEWGFMLNDPRMTNSTFIEGYSTNGSLHYAPYENDPRVSHAHGWSTGPTSLLSFYVAGLHLTSAQGKTWKIAPQIGDLTSVDAGFSSALGAFQSSISAGAEGELTAFSFSVPNGTSGDVSLPGVGGTLVSGAQRVVLSNGEAKGLAGGAWVLELSK